jgi:putative Mn2+ efflux pump MntP
VLKLALLIVPLGLDTFAVSAALGFAGLPEDARLRVSLLMSAFETLMPLVGLLVGHGLGGALGDVADYVAIGLLAAVGAWMVVERGESEDQRVAKLASGHGLAAVALGMSISLDELAIGFTIGLLHLNVWVAVVLIGIQAFLFAQLGLRLGARLGSTAREGAERLAGVLLLGVALLLFVEQLV